jgi:ribosomal protein L18
MATGGLYGSTTTGDLVATSGAESTGLYGNNTNIGGTYFEWFIFYESTTAPATPTGGSWNFLTNVGVPPSGWSSTPPTNPTHTVWASISIVNSRSPAALTWTAPATWTQQGPTGTAATIAAGTTTTGAPGTSATVTNSGTSSAAVFNFQIPRGDVGATGATGATGTAATVAVGTTTTLSPGSSATVTNSGTTAAAVFNFGVPQGLTGATGATGATGPAGMNWRGNWSSGTFYSINDGVFDSVSGSSYIATATSTNQQPPNGSYWNLLAQKGANGTGVGTVTSVDVSGGTTGLTSFGGPITSSGTVTLAGTLNVANGGTGVTTSTGSGSNVLSTSPTLVTPVLGTPTSGNFSTGTFTWPTFNQNTSGTAANVTGTVAIANGGTGATSAANALTNLGAIGAITSNDGSVTIATTGTSRDLSVAVAAATNNVICQVRNTTGATLTKGTVVYISGATGQLPTVSKALATSDVTSAQTLGMITADLANNSNGNVTVIGLITDIDTSAYTDGAQLYLSGTTAGTVTATKPYAPIHLVYVAVVEHAHPTQGKLFVKVQNGYELDELHNVSAQSPTNGQTIVYNSSTSLWEKNTVSLTAGVNGTLPVANGGTGVTTSTGTGSVVLSTSPTLVTPLLGTPTSGNFSTGTFTWPTFNQSTTGNAATATTATNVSGGTASVTTLTTSSTVTLSGGTANGVAYLNGSKVLTTGSALTFDGTNTATTGTITVTKDGVGFRAASAATNFSHVTLGNDIGGGITYIESGKGGTGSYVPLTFFANGSEKMRIGVATGGVGAVGIGYTSLTSVGDSGLAVLGNVGIGTSSPAAKLNVVGADAAIVGLIAGATNGIRFIPKATSAEVAATDKTGTSSYQQLDLNGSLLTFLTSGTEGMRLTSTGLGIGTSSPSTLLTMVGTTGKQSILKLQAASGSAGGFKRTLINLRDDTGVGGYDIVGYGDISNALGFDSVASGTATTRMLLDSAGNLGIGTSSPGTKLDVAGAVRSSVSGGTPIFYLNNGTTQHSIQNNSGSLAFYNDGTRGMDLTSTGLGIGTSSPASKLNVSGGAVFIDNTVTADYLRFRGSAVGLSGGINASSAAAYLGTYTAHPLWITTNNAVVATFDSSGNLGLGVTPSAWSGAKGFDIGSRTAVYENSGNAASGITNNLYIGSGGYTYKTTAAASALQQLNGIFYWYQAASGTGGTVASLTQAMTLDASGNLGVGTTSASARLHVDSGSTGLMGLFNSANANGGYIIGQSSGTSVWDFGTAKQALNVGGSSDVAINARSGFLAFGTGSTERARIDSSGNLLVGSTSNVSNGRLSIKGAASLWATGVQVGTDGIYAMGVINSAGTTVGGVIGNTSSTSYATSSDYRLKNIIGPITTSGAYIDSLNPVEGTWKSDGSVFVGLLAHEAQESSRTAVATGTKDGAEMQAMDYSSPEIIANLIAEIKSLRKRLADAGIA